MISNNGLKALTHRLKNIFSTHQSYKDIQIFYGQNTPTFTNQEFKKIYLQIYPDYYPTQQYGRRAINTSPNSKNLQNF